MIPLKSHLTKAREQVKDWKGTSPEAPVEEQVALIPDDADLERQPLALLEAEIKRLEKLVSFDRHTAQKFATLSKRIVEESAALVSLKERLADCLGAKQRARTLVQERETAYENVFESIVLEQAVLTELYSPLMSCLSAAEGALEKLSFSVTREADVDHWAAEGERLLDLRHKGPFKGRGTLGQLAAAALKAAWEIGDPRTVSAAMTKFRSDNLENLLEKSAVPKGDLSDYRTWAKAFARWLYSAEHISIRYSIDYEGIDIRKLSPGTRGIVLLLLYLALDDNDDRPLIIDQPEESLDPKSIFDELVGLFLEAKRKRQVIMVTHNANLVVNTDADQVIVAQAGPHMPHKLPPISYLSGGLESSHIRKAVCDILEGGERAFQERARRLRVRLDR